MKRKLIRRAKAEQKRIALIIAHITQRVCDIITIISALWYVVVMGYIVLFCNYQSISLVKCLLIIATPPIAGIMTGLASERLDSEIKRLER